MAIHNQFGKDAEDLAAEYFAERGYKILHRNWRFHRHEIDIIAMKGDSIHFIEVKARNSNINGNPEESIGKKKFAGLLTAADEFMYQNQQYREAQYDVLAITMEENRKPEFFLLEDVFL